MIQSGEDQLHYRAVIGEENKEDYLPEEREAYKIIDEFLNADVLKFRKNESFYIDLIKTEPLTALMQTQNKRFERFNVEMARATAEGFEKASNAEKGSFIDYFTRMWQINICTQDYNRKLSEEGFQLLKDLLIQFKNKCKDKSLYISEAHADRFLENLENLFSEQAGN